jgi:hypothetical protein
MPAKHRRPATPIQQQIKPVLKPIVEPVLERLDRHEQLLDELKASLDIQFKRTAALQVQLDRILAAVAKTRA